MNCPRCGLKHPDNYQTPWQPTHTIQSAAPLALPAKAGQPAPEFSSAYRKTPYRAQNLVSDALVPLIQAVATGVLAALVFGVVAVPILDLRWYSAAVVGVVVTGLAWIIYLGDSKQTLWIIEEITGRDIDGDGHTGAPPQEPPAWTVKAVIEDRERNAWHFAQLPGQPAALHGLAVAIERGDSFSERTATKYGYTQEQFAELRDTMIDRGLAIWNHPTRRQNGVSLLRGGRVLMREISNDAPPTTETDL